MIAAGGEEDGDGRWRWMVAQKDVNRTEGAGGSELEDVNGSAILQL